MGLCHWQTKTKLSYCNWIIVSFCSNSTKPLDIVAIDNLPSLLPRESSIQFADSIMPYLLKLPEVFPRYFFFSHLPVLVCCVIIHTILPSNKLNWTKLLKVNCNIVFILLFLTMIYHIWQKKTFQVSLRSQALVLSSTTPISTAKMHLNELQVLRKQIQWLKSYSY